MDITDGIVKGELTGLTGEEYTLVRHGRTLKTQNDGLWRVYIAAVDKYMTIDCKLIEGMTEVEQAAIAKFKTIAEAREFADQ